MKIRIKACYSRDDSSLPLYSVSCTVHLHLFTNILLLKYFIKQTEIYKFIKLERWLVRPIYLFSDNITNVMTNIFHRNNITINQMMFIYSPNSFYKVYLTTLKNSKLKWIV